MQEGFIRDARTIWAVKSIILNLKKCVGRFFFIIRIAESSLRQVCREVGYVTTGYVLYLTLFNVTKIDSSPSL